MTALQDARSTVTSIQVRLYSTIGAVVTIAVAIVIFQFWDTRARSHPPGMLFEYHLASLFGIDRIQSELLEFQTALVLATAGGNVDAQALDADKVRRAVLYHFDDVVARHKAHGESALTSPLERATERARDVFALLDRFDASDEASLKRTQTDVSYFVDSLRQLERMHLNIYQSDTARFASDQATMRRWLLLGIGLIVVFGAGFVIVLLRQMRASLQRQFETDQQLTALNASLEDKVAQRTAELSAAKDAADRANESKTRFLAAASHDLRQPVQAIAILAYALKENIDDEAIRPMLDNLESNTDVIVDLLNDILDISKLDAGAMEPQMQTVSMDELLRSIEQSFAVQAQEKGLDLRVVSNTASVRSDPVFLGRILQNIVANAIRYTDQGKILVGCRRRGANLHIDVCDTGKGIRESHLEKIFEEFYQVDNPSRNRRAGMGLGLAIVQRLARALGQDLDVSSVEGKGTRFSITVPLDGEPAIAQSPTDSIAIGY